MNFYTFSGKEIDLLNPTVEDICIEDIAHALPNICRFNGHVKRFYSVAEHSILCANLIQNKKYRLEALLHDASEAYLGDVTRPLKASLPEYSSIEKNFQRVIAKKFGFAYPMPKEVIEIDDYLLSIERGKLSASSNALPVDFDYHKKLKEAFLHTYFNITK